MSAEPEPEPERRSRRPGWVDRLGLTRSTTDRVVAGVAGGIAERLGVDPVVVRLAFVVLALAGGVGAVLYLVIWLLAPERAPQPAPAADRATLPVRILAILLVVLGSLLVLRDLGLWLGDGLVWPVAIAALGSAVIWTRGDGAGRGRLARSPATQPRQGGRSRTRRRWRSRLRLLAGSLLVLGGMTSLLIANNALAAARVARGVAFAVVVTVSGLALILGPWVFRLVRQLGEERRERIRSEERAEVAAHLHDSVLQTLAMIQRSPSAEEMASLARGQERELRTWLYGRTRPSPNGRRMLSEALDEAATRVERLHHVAVETVVVGDCPLDDRLRAVVDAAGEALSNAAKHSGARAVSVYVEVGPETVQLYVRDQGRGFVPGSLAPDRRGISDSIVGRMERHGGVATIASEPAEGTEVHLRMPRRAS